MPTEIVPSAAALTKCLDFARRNPEVASYLREKFFKKMVKAGLQNDPAVKRIIEQLEETERNVAKQSERSDPWSGAIEVKTDFQTLQAKLGEEAENNVKKIFNSPVELQYVVSENSEMLRAFAVNGSYLENPEQVKILDNLLNAHFASKNLVSKGSVIYEADEHGNIIKDKDGNEIKTNPEKIKETLERSLVTEMDAKGVTMTVFAIDMPEVEIAPEAAVPAQPQPEAAQEPQPVPEETKGAEAEPEPEPGSSINPE